MTNMDKLYEAVEARGPVCVGLDTDFSYLPADFVDSTLTKGENIVRFNKKLIDATKAVAGCYKVQIAYYESLGLDGMRAYAETLKLARATGLPVIADIKRGDIGSTAAAYAAHIGGTEIAGERFDLWHEDFVTVNPYLGIDGIQPFIDACNKENKGIFVLVKTSNPSSSQLQDILVDSKPVYLHVAALVDEWGRGAMGASGYSRVCAVVGAPHRAEGARVRAALPHTFFLVPGYGAQGGTAEDIRGFFDKDGRGCIGNSSRGIIAAYKKNEKYGEHDFADAARDAALAMKKDIMG